MECSGWDHPSRVNSRCRLCPAVIHHRRVRAHPHWVFACVLPPTPRAPDPATTPPSLFSPFFRLSSRRPTTQPAPVPPLILISGPLTGSSLFSSSDADPVKWIPTLRGQELDPITTAFIFMTQEAAGELGLCRSLSLSLPPAPCLSFKLGN